MTWVALRWLSYLGECMNVTTYCRKENISFELSSGQTIPLLWRGEELPTSEIVYAAVILLFVYILIIFEVLLIYVNPFKWDEV